jgi:hypothetical protein
VTTTVTKLDATRRHLDALTATRRKALASTMRQLAERLTAEADRIDADATHTPNPLGVVQGFGQAIDTACAELGVMRDWTRSLAE